jgi:DNA-directed RNA polymerase beta' subunit
MNMHLPQTEEARAEAAGECVEKLITWSVEL